MFCSIKNEDINYSISHVLVSWLTQQGLNAIRPRLGNIRVAAFQPSTSLKTVTPLNYSAEIAIAAVEAENTLSLATNPSVLEKRVESLDGLKPFINSSTPTSDHIENTSIAAITDSSISDPQTLSLWYEILYRCILASYSFFYELALILLSGLTGCWLSYVAMTG